MESAPEEAAVDVTEADDFDDAAEALLALSELLFQATSEVDEIEKALHDPARPPKADALKGYAGRIPILDGDVDKLQIKVDAVGASSTASRKRRRELTEQSTALSERVHCLPAMLTEAITALAGAHKEAGNGYYKRGEYDAAIRSYSDAISVDRKTPVYYSNRSACYQAKSMWREAASDARECLSLDVSFAKGYKHLVTSLLRLGERDEAAKTLASAPLALASNADLIALSTQVQSELKAAGNAALKEGRHDAAIRLYTQCLSLDDTQPVYYSNRSAVHQAKRMWREAASDAHACIRLDRAFAKGYLHLGKTRLAQGEHEGAKAAVQDGIAALQEAGQPTSTYAPLQELLKTITAQTPRGGAPSIDGGGSNGPSPSATPAASGGGGPASERAASYKERGNVLYKSGQYAEALKCYSMAIGTCPDEGSYYGNRAACWMMIGKYERAVDDCAEGLRRDTSAGGGPAPAWVGKLRARQATALTHVGKLDRAEDVLAEGMERGGEGTDALKASLKTVRELKLAMTVGAQAMEEGAYTKAETCLAKLLTSISQSTDVIMLHAECLLRMRRPIDAARAAQKAIALDEDLLRAYVLRAEALHSMGQTEKAIKHLREALSRDPDNTEASRTLKRLRRLTVDMERLKGAMATAMTQRRFEEAISACGEAIKVGDGDRHLTAPLYAERAKAYQRLARSRASGVTRKEREVASGGGSPSSAAANAPAGADDKEEEEEEDPRAGANGAWRRCLQDCGTAIYEDPTQLAPYLLKAEALQAMERWGEALGALEACLSSDPSRQHDQSVLQKVAEAQFLVKKAQRKDLYALIGIKGVGSAKSEKEIRFAYKKAALECHPDKASNDDERKAFEVKFKELGEALDVLTDDFKRKLWDEGHDLESIAQRVQMRDQQQGHGGGPR